MIKRRGLVALLCLTALLAPVSGEPAFFPDKGQPIVWTSYSDAGAGAGWMGALAPILEASGGFWFHPDWSLGGFVSVAPLSDMEHASLGLSIANQKAAYALMSGTELWFSPFQSWRIHPVAGLRLGGMTLGRLIDIDGKEGYEGSVGERSFFASVLTGAEANLTDHVRLLLKGGWRFSPHAASMGLDKGALGGPELSLGVRLLWKTVID